MSSNKKCVFIFLLFKFFEIYCDTPKDGKQCNGFKCKFSEKNHLFKLSGTLFTKLFASWHPFFGGTSIWLNRSKISRVYRVCHGFRITKRDYYFWPFLKKASFFMAAKTVAKMDSSLKPNHHNQIQPSLSKSLTHSVSLSAHRLEITSLESKIVGGF